MKLSKSTLGAAVAIALGTVAAPASAGVMNMTWNGVFTMLDAAGAGLANTSITTKGANQFQTQVTGTMAFDTTTFAGTATLNGFDFFAGTAQAVAVGINMQTIGAGPLVLGNMLFNWNGNYGIPVSIVMDAQGMFASMPASMGGTGEIMTGPVDNTTVAVSNYGATPASDGTYINATWGYLGLGPVPMATTEWNTTGAADCGTNNNSTLFSTGGGCMTNGAAGLLDLVADTTANGNEFAQGDGYGIGGVPMWDGPFAGFNANFDVTSLTVTSFSEGSIGPFDIGPAETSLVPVPAAVWLFGSGLLGLVGVARRKQAA